MAIVKYALPFADLRGKIGGVVATANASGNAIREWVIPRNPRSIRQIQSRQNLAAAAPVWQSLTSGQRDGWYTYAANTPLTNSLGQEHYTSGWGMYCRAYTLNQYSLAPNPSDPPTSYGLAAAPGVTAVTITGGTANLVLTFPAGVWWRTLANAALLAHVSSSQAPTRRTLQSPSRIILVADGSVGTPVVSPLTITNPWGVVAAGRVTYVTLQALDADNQIGVEQTLRVTAV